MPEVRIVEGECLESLRRMPGGSVQCCVTSPPYYGLRSYLPKGHKDKHLEIGLEATPEAYVARMVEVFREVRRVLRQDGTLFLNIGDSYASGTKGSGGTGKSTLLMDGREESQRIRTADRSNGAAKFGTRSYDLSAAGLKPKDMIGIPWMLAFALRADGWWLRQEIIWDKPNPMPSSVRDRCTTSHEHLFLLAKSANYYCDMEAISEESLYPPGTRRDVEKGGFDSKWAGGGARAGDESFRAIRERRNKRSVWRIPPSPYAEAHFAVMPEKLVEPCIMAGTSAEGCCPRCGAPRRRVVERQRRATRPGRDTKVMPEEGRLEGLVTGNRDPQRHVTLARTTGWEAGCPCPPAEPLPCTVLDPFAGSGTVPAVAVRLGRSAVGLELNPEYALLARKRCAKAAGLNPLFEAATVELESKGN